MEESNLGGRGAEPGKEKRTRKRRIRGGGGLLISTCEIGKF